MKRKETDAHKLSDSFFKAMKKQHPELFKKSKGDDKFLNTGAEMAFGKKVAKELREVDEFFDHMEKLEKKKKHKK